MNYLEARGVEPLFPVCYVQQRPRMLYQSHFRGEHALMHKRGRARMLLVLLLSDKRLGSVCIARKLCDNGRAWKMAIGPLPIDPTVKTHFRDSPQRQ
jgi:hypothetical protein